MFDITNRGALSPHHLAKLPRSASRHVAINANCQSHLTPGVGLLPVGKGLQLPMALSCSSVRCKYKGEGSVRRKLAQIYTKLLQMNSEWSWILKPFVLVSAANPWNIWTCGWECGSIQTSACEHRHMRGILVNMHMQKTASAHHIQPHTFICEFTPWATNAALPGFHPPCEQMETHPGNRRCSELREQAALVQHGPGDGCGFASGGFTLLHYGARAHRGAGDNLLSKLDCNKTGWTWLPLLRQIITL